MINSKYFRFNGRNICWSDTKLVTEAFIEFLREMALLDHFEKDLMVNRQLSIEQLVDDVAEGSRNDLVNGFPWQDTYVGFSAYSAARDSWRIIMDREIPMVEYTAFKENGKLIQERRSKPK